MKLKLLFALLVVTISNAQTQIGQDIVGDMPDDNFGWGVALSADGNVLAVSGTRNDNNGTDAGHIRVYSKTSGTWTQIGQDIEGPNPDDQIGYKIALSDDGSTLAFSATYSKYVINNISYGGFVKVYKNVNGSWIQMAQELREDDPMPIFGQTFGFGLSLSLSLDGTTIAIGQNNPLNYNNKVIIYKFISGNWTKIKEIIANDYNVYPNTENFFTSHSEFGWNVSLSGDGNTIAFSDITGHTSSSIYGSGVVIVYKYQSGTWIKVGNTISGKSNDTNFGHRVVLSDDGSVLAISARFSDNNGANSGNVEVYKINGNNWIQIGNDIVGAAADTCGQGLVISADGNILAVGSTGADTVNGTDTGKVRVFQNIQGNWVEQGSVIGANAGDAIGWSIALSKDGHNLAIGNYGSSSVGAKPSKNIEEQLIIGDLPIVNNYQAKGGTAGSVQVFDISGILSSDTFVLENFNIYPNPTTEILNIELDNNLTLEKVLVYDTAGKLVKETTEKTINVSAFTKGMYNVQVVTNQGKATKKVIVE